MKYFIPIILITFSFSLIVSCTETNKKKSPNLSPISNTPVIHITKKTFNPTPIPTITPLPSPTYTPIPGKKNENNTSTVVPTSTSIPDPTSTPDPPSTYIDEMAKLIFEKNVTANELILTSVKRTYWTDESMDCPEPGIYYKKYNPPDFGYIYILESNDKKWEFHSNSTGLKTINCNEIKNTNISTINITQKNSLQQTNEIYIFRYSQDRIPVLTAEIKNKIDIEKISEILNVNIPIKNTSNCKPAFQIVFIVKDKEIKFDWLCKENKNMIRGHENSWDELESVVSKEFGIIIGKYLTGKPIPAVPGM